MKDVCLDARLSAVAGLVPVCPCVADIGCDHGRLALEMLKRGCGRVIVGDISAPSLKKAQGLLEENGYGASFSARVGDGLGVLAAGDGVEALVLAGMGAGTMQGILTRGQGALKGVKWLVLQPQNHIAGLRVWLAENGYRVEEEALALCRGRYYVALRARRGEPQAPGNTAFARFIGPLLPRQKPELLRDYVAFYVSRAKTQRQKAAGAKSPRAARRAMELDEFILQGEEFLACL